jgi:hypothetical protein
VKNPHNIINKSFIVSMDTFHWLLFFKNPSPPVYEDNDIEKSVDARSIESIPPPRDFARDFHMFKQPPLGLDGTPLNKDQIYKVGEGLFPLGEIWEAVRASSGHPLANLNWSLGSGKGPIQPGLVIGFDMNVMLKDLLEVGILDFIEIVKYINFSFSLPMAMEKRGDVLRVNIIW